MPRRSQVRFLDISDFMVGDAPEACKGHVGEVWCIIDVRGVPDWQAYRAAFLELAAGAGAERCWIMSSYGHAGWMGGPQQQPKTWETLRALQEKMGVGPRFMDAATEDKGSTGHIQVLITGAGFELAESGHDGSSIGCPSTRSLIEGMRPEGEPLPKVGDGAYFPVLIVQRFKRIADQPSLDDYWDSVLSFFGEGGVPRRTPRAANWPGGRPSGARSLPTTTGSSSRHSRPHAMAGTTG